MIDQEKNTIDNTIDNGSRINSSSSGNIIACESIAFSRQTWQCNYCLQQDLKDYKDLIQLKLWNSETKQLIKTFEI